MTASFHPPPRTTTTNSTLCSLSYLQLQAVWPWWIAKIALIVPGIEQRVVQPVHRHFAVKPNVTRTPRDHFVSHLPTCAQYCMALAVLTELFNIDNEA